MLLQRKFLEKAQRLVADIECPPTLAATLRRIEATLAALEEAADGTGAEQQQASPPPGVPGSGSARSRAKRARQEQHQQQQRERPSSAPTPGARSSPQPSPSQRDASAAAGSPHATASASGSPQSPASGAQQRSGSGQPPPESVPPGYVWCVECGTLHPATDDDPGRMPEHNEFSSEEEQAEAQGALDLPP